MMEIIEQNTNGRHSSRVERYYRFHSHIYDATRWTFLFGRKTLLDMVPDISDQPRILEVGCGTGTNMEQLQFHFPGAHILGIDLSEDMLGVARNKLGTSNRIQFMNAEYGTDRLQEGPFDMILFSYSLTMFDEPREQIFEQISRDLKPNGYIAVVDFNTSPYRWFRRWMAMNHVDLSGHLLPLLKKYFKPAATEVKPAYLGLWSYFIFLGRQW